LDGKDELSFKKPLFLFSVTAEFVVQELIPASVTAASAVPFLMKPLRLSFMSGYLK
jgi:hypothetical protein